MNHWGIDAVNPALPPAKTEETIIPNPFAPLALVAAIAAGLLATPATAQSVRVLGEHNAWSAYATTESEGRICFVLSRPTATEPASSGTGGAYFYITHRPAQAIRSEINLVAGYQFAAGSVATLSVGGQGFELYTEGDAAWLADPGEAGAAVQAIRAGSSMVIEGTAASGETVRQRFSLSGATAATTDINGAC